MRIKEIINEAINPDILHPTFKHKQRIGNYTYYAFYTEKFGKPKLRIECFDGDKRVAVATFSITDDALISDVTYVIKSHQKQGIASIMYAYAKMLGNDILPSPEQTDQGKEMWDSWRKSGEAEHLLPEEINPDILHKDFKHKQQIGDFLYVAKTYVENENFYLFVDAYDGKKQVAHAEFKIENEHLVSDMTWTKKDYQGLGIASTMYAYAKMLGNDIVPSRTQTDAGKAMWHSWKKSGEAEHLMSK